VAVVVMLVPVVMVLAFVPHSLVLLTVLAVLAVVAVWAA